MIRPLLGLWVLLCGAALLSGVGVLPGSGAFHGLQSWWTARQFESAALHEDLDGLERLSQALQEQHAGDEALRFAAQRLGFHASAPSWNLPPAEARGRAQQGCAMLAQSLDTSDQPWENLHIQGLILVNRLKSTEDKPRRLEVAAQWLAAGGGPDYPFRTPGESYRQALRLLATEREGFLTRCFQIAHAEAEE